MTQTIRQAELIAATPLSSTVRNLFFRMVDGQGLSYVAGQWINLDVKNGEQTIRRAYSIASAPGRAVLGDFEIAVTKVDEGPVSSILHAMPIGTHIEVTSALGFFTREKKPDGAAVFIGTGTGLTPLRAMLQQELRNESGTDLVLLYGCRTEKDILWHDEFKDLEKQTSRFRYEVTLSRPSPEWQGRKGYVQTHLEEIVPKILPAHFYVCGLSDMVEGVRTVLKERLGLPRQVIHTERYD